MARPSGAEMSFIKRSTMQRGVFLMLLCGVCLAASAHAADAAPGKPVAVKHIAPRPQDLPAPGGRVKLSLQLANTREITQTVSALIVLDGRVMNITAGEGYLNEYDNPTFEVVTASPAAELAYQFAVKSADGSVVTSKRFVVTRRCLPKLDLTDASLGKEIQGNEQLRALLEKTKGLERDLAYYETALRSVNDLKELLDDE